MRIYRGGRGGTRRGGENVEETKTEIASRGCGDRDVGVWGGREGGRERVECKGVGRKKVDGGRRR